MIYLFKQSLTALACSGLLVISTDAAFGWGERGHDVVTRVAVRLVAERSQEKSLPAVLIRREHMLAHITNVPDIVWRVSNDPTVIAANLPTHFIDVDLLMEKPAFATFPLLITDAKTAASKFGKNLFTEVGTAPWRIRQLFLATKTALAEIKADANTRQPAPQNEVNPATDKALLTAGLMAHFVGDLAQPLHNCKNYDGWDIGQGGIHSYYEEAVISAFDLRLDYEVFSYAAINKPFQAELTKVFPKQTMDQLSKDPLAIAAALAVVSFAHIPALQKLDKTHAVLQASYEKDLKVPAKRRPATETARKFRQFSIQRLALAADTLAHLWLLAWDEAGRPDLSNYVSYTYPVAPTFIAPDYLEQ